METPFLSPCCGLSCVCCGGGSPGLCPPLHPGAVVGVRGPAAHGGQVLCERQRPGAECHGWLADLPQRDVQQQHRLPGDRHVPAGHQRRLHPKHRVLWRSWCLQLERWGPWGEGRGAETTTPVRPWGSLPDLPHKRAEESMPLPPSATSSTSAILKHFLGTRGRPVILINLKMQVLLYPFYRKLSLGEVK